jgi:uncharacterized protein YeaO (DUF488 family)
MARPSIDIERADDAPAKSTSLRFLVDRLWPRIVRKKRCTSMGG